MKVVQPLLTAMGNTHHPDSQRQAALALKVCGYVYMRTCVCVCVCVCFSLLDLRAFSYIIQVLLGCDEGVKDDVEHIMGSTLFQKFWVNVHTHTRMLWDQCSPASHTRHVHSTSIEVHALQTHL